MSDTEEDKLRYELLGEATTTAAQRIAELAAARSARLHELRERQLVLVFNEALEATCRKKHAGMGVRGLHVNPLGFPENRPDAALLTGETGPPAAVLEYEWLSDAECSPWYAAACVLDLFSLGATVEAGLARAAHFVVGAPREGNRGGLAQLLATLESLTPFVTRSELESFAPDWWLRWHRRGDSGYESPTPPQVPEELELRPKIIRDIPPAKGEQPWRLYCVQVRPVAPHVIEARAKSRAQMEKKKQTEAELLANAKARLPDIEALLAAFERAEEDAVYRYYHQSFKVFGQQAMIRRARELLHHLAPDAQSLDDGFERICHDALDHEFKMSRTNTNWGAETRPILEAFWHCKYFLGQLNRYAREIDEPVDMLPEGWAAVLELYGLR